MASRPFLCRMWLALVALCTLGAIPAVNADKKVGVKENLFDSVVADIKWFAQDHRIVLCNTVRGRLYRSTDAGVNWKDITSSIKGDDMKEASSPSQSQELVVHKIIASPSDKNVLMIVGSEREHYVSADAGAKWTKLKIKSNIHTFIFHPRRPRWALLSAWTDSCEHSNRRKKKDADKPPGWFEDLGPCQHTLYITKDMGRSFTPVISYVVQFGWGDIKHNQEDRIYFTHFRKKSGDQPRLSLWSKNVNFARTDDAGSTTTKMIEQGNKFLASNGFIFVAQLKDAESQNVRLLISADGAKTFETATLPMQLEDKSYTLLDTSEGAIMLHVNHGSRENGAVGNIYISDETGTRFTLSLEDNVRNHAGECEFDKILGVEGVYMANFRDNHENEKDFEEEFAEDDGDDDDYVPEGEEVWEASQVDHNRNAKAKSKKESVVRTVITFDKGGRWDRLKPPTVDSLGKKIDCPPVSCWLHLHGQKDFRNFAPFYSLENAVGLILGTGNVGPFLRYEPDQVNTYMSRDGGLTWVEAHKGAFIYEFGDHGGLAVMADDLRKTQQVIFSWNEGQSWYDFSLDGLVEVDNILTEPNSTASKFLLHGRRGNNGVIYHLDFEQLGQPLCKGVWAADSASSDYETWSPSDGRKKEKCILGRQVTYTRRKQASECFNGEQFERPVEKTKCECTEEDYECEMGFARKVESMECKVAEPWLIEAPDSCTSSGFHYVVAHRKVVGDTCSGGYQPQKVAVPCPATSRMSNGAVSLLGTICMLALIMMAVIYISSSEHFKKMFANYGFENFNNVKYATIGTRVPETALDSVGARLDNDFFDESKEEDETPALMSYGGLSRPDPIVRGAADIATEAVPRLAAPPGAAAADDGADLL